MEPDEAASFAEEEGAITASRLEASLATDDLASLTHLRMVANSHRCSLDVLPELLPSLRDLYLGGSSLSSVRDLGTSFRALRVLNLGRCGLKDLDGIEALDQLHELHAPFNEIDDVSSLFMHRELAVLDLDSNKLRAASALEPLAPISTLRELVLQGNPLTVLAHYRQVVCSRLEAVEHLDHEQVSLEERKRLSEELESMKHADRQRDLEDLNMLKLGLQPEIGIASIFLSEGLRSTEPSPFLAHTPEEARSMRASMSSSLLPPRGGAQTARPGSAIGLGRSGGGGGRSGGGGDGMLTSRTRGSPAASALLSKAAIAKIERRRPGTARRHRERPASAAVVSSRAKLGGAGRRASAVLDIPRLKQQGSGLTFGASAPMCGSIMMAMRARRRSKRDAAGK